MIGGWLAVIIYAIVVIVPGLLPNNVLAATNIMMTSGNYADVQPAEADDVLPPEVTARLGLSDKTNVLAGDTVDSVLPSMSLLEERAQHGDLAEWNPYSVGGVELAAVPNSGHWSPLALPWWLGLDVMAPAVSKLLELGAIALGMSLFLRRLKVPAVAWPLASLAFATSGFMLAWSGWPQTRVAAFIPLVFWAIEKVIADGRWRSVPFLGIALGAMWLGGFPAVVFHTLYLGSAYAVFRALTLNWSRAERWLLILKNALTFVAGVVLSLFVAALALIPFWINATTVINVSQRNMRGLHLPFEALATMIVPWALGAANMDGLWGDTNPVESFSYIGVAVLGLAVLALLLRRRLCSLRATIVFFWAAALALVSAVYIAGPILDIIQMLPTMSSSHAGRLRGIIGFVFAVLAAFGITALVQEPVVVALPEVQQPSRVGVLHRIGERSIARQIDDVCVWALAGISVLAVAWSVLEVLLKTPTIDHVIRWIKLSLLAIFVLVIAVKILAQISVAWVQSAGILVIATLILLPGVSIGRNWLVANPRATYFPEDETMSYLSEHLGENRFASWNMAIFAGSSSYYQVRDVAGHQFMTNEWKDALTEVEEGALRSPTYAALSDPGSVQSPMLDRLSVEYAVFNSGQPLPGRIEQTDKHVEARTELSAAHAQVRSEQRSGPTRGVIVPVGANSGWDGQPLNLKAELVSSAGRVLATTSVWWQTIPQTAHFAFDGESITEGEEWYVRVSLLHGDITLQFNTDAHGELLIDNVVPEADGLDVVQTNEVTVVVRKTVLDRVRWASNAEVIPDSAARIERLNSDELPGNTVVLNTAPEQQWSHSESSAEISADQDARVDHDRYRVDANGSGWFVVADSLARPGWSATLNGQSVDLVRADHFGAAVFIGEAGSYDLEFHYEGPGLRAGAIVSGATLILIVAFWGVLGIVERRRSTARASRPNGAK